ncbi:MAG: hypothetical protein A3J75_02475, partial [Acidobacteria bacterium RBG_16_68_9]
MVVPKSIDSGAAASLGEALLVNLGLLALFAVQHTVMARPGFKKAWTRIIPEPIERSTFVLVASLLLLLLFWQWRPLPAVVWELESGIASLLLWVLFWCGWVLVFGSSFVIDHFDLFGLRQVTLFALGRKYTYPTFQVSAFYRFVRHPLLLGFLIAFWSTPRMTVGHLVFALAITGYIVMGIQFEERDLVRFHGAPYEAYRRRVPMLLPRLRMPYTPSAESGTASAQTGVQK